MGEPVGRLMSGLARAVKSLRERRAWTLDALAKRSGISKGMLVQIENSRVNPSLGTLVRLADALGTTVASLVEVEERPSVQVNSATAQKALWRGRGRSVAHLLGASDFDAHVESWRWFFAAGDGYESHAHPHGTAEHLFILSGTLRLCVGGEDYSVIEGSSAVFEADRPHGYWNASSRESLALVMLVVTPKRLGARSHRK